MNIVLILACMAVFYNIDLLGYNSEYLSVQQTKKFKRDIYTHSIIPSPCNICICR